MFGVILTTVAFNIVCGLRDVAVRFSELETPDHFLVDVFERVRKHK